MRSICSNPSLSDLPPPLSDQTGWPWTDDLLNGSTDGSINSPINNSKNSSTNSSINSFSNTQTNYPRISIITPSYNQGAFIEATIRSVLLQGYPNLEYIIVDGGSTDQTIEIVKRYADWITAWVSESDRGQSHAINKGLTTASGDILAYLNSDDYYLPGALRRVAAYYHQFPQTDLLHGRCRYVDAVGNSVGEQFGQISSLDEIVDLWDVWWAQRQFVQPEVFWTRAVMQQVGTVREDLHYGMDYDYWCRILAAGGTVGRLDAAIACFRLTPHQKSSQREAVSAELLTIVQPLLWPDPPSTAKLPLLKRWQLQGKWLYHTLFLEQVARSRSSGDRLLWRWLKSAAVLLRHPKILLVPTVQTRIGQALSRLTVFKWGSKRCH